MDNSWIFGVSSILVGWAEPNREGETETASHPPLVAHERPLTGLGYYFWMNSFVYASCTFTSFRSVPVRLRKSRVVSHAAGSV